MRNIIGVHKNQAEFLPDKHGKPIYVGSLVLNYEGVKRRVVALNESTVSPHRGAVHTKFIDGYGESWACSDQYEVAQE